MSLFNVNMAALKRSYPLLHKMLSEKREDRVRYADAISESRSGTPTIQLNGQFVHSRFDPLKESRRFIDSERSPEASVYIMAGFGLGYHVESLYEMTDSEIIIVVEPDLPLFLQALALRDFTRHIRSGRVLFLIGTAPEDTVHILEQHTGKLVQLIILRSLYKSNQDYYDRLDRCVRNYISRKEVNLSTLKRFGKLWLRNLSENAHLIADSPGIKSLEGSFQGVPALLIAAGPSLDNIKDHLPELKERFLLVAVDTALRACLDVGVEPDFTVVVDPQYWNTRHLDRCHADNTILISDTSTYPTVFRQIKGKSFLCSSSFPLGLFLENGTETKGKLKAGGSVATAAWDFCRIIGVEEIWCAGLDLGFPQKQTHCRGSYFEQRAHWLSVKTLPCENSSWHALIDAGLHVVEANSGGKTWSDRRMALYVRWFEEQMGKYPEVKSWNLSKGGIKISGMPSGSLMQSLNLPQVRHIINEKIGETRLIKTDKNLYAKLMKSLEVLISELESLKDLSREGLSLSKELRIQFDKDENISSVVNGLSEVDQLILNRSAKDIAGFILQDFIHAMAREKKSPDPQDIINNSLTLYSELFRSINFQIDLLEKSLKKLKNIQE